MNDDFDVIIENEKEWRRHLISEIRDIKLDMGDMNVNQNSLMTSMEHLKFKVALISGSISIAASVFAAFVYKKLGLS